MRTFALLLLMVLVVFHVPIRGPFGALALGTLHYAFSTCGFGQLVSTFTRTQVAAVFATVVLAIIPVVNYSGLLVPVCSLTGRGRLIGLLLTAAWFQPISVGTLLLSAMESMPVWLDYPMKAINPTPHFVIFSQDELYRGADVSIV